MQVRIDLSGVALPASGTLRKFPVPGGGAADSGIMLPVGYDLATVPITATVNGVPIQNPSYALESRDPTSIQPVGTGIKVIKRSAAAGVWVRAVLQAGVNTGGAAPTDSILIRAITAAVSTSRPTAVLAALKDTTQLVATATGQPHAGGAIDTIAVPGFVWRSTNTAVATVDAAGRLVSVGNGTATVYVKSDFDSTAIAVTVKQQVAKWRLNTDTASIAAIGDSATVTATALDLRDQVVDTLVTNAQPSWSLTDPSLATLTTVGKAATMVALLNGSTALTAQTVSADTAVIRFLGGSAVKKIGVLRVAQIATSVLPVGLDSTTIEAPFLTFKFRARALDRRGIDITTGAAITWTSTNPAVARVDTSGTVEALTVGVATIRAQRDGAVRNFPVVVTNPPKAIGVSPKPITFVSLLDTTRLTAVVRNARPDTLVGAPVTWSSVDPAIATITPIGSPTSNVARVQAVATGTTRIIATAAAGVVDTVVVTVSNIATQVALTQRSVTLASINDSTAPAVTVRNARGDPMSTTVVTWVSRDPSIMTVTATGIVIARAQGTATLVASSGTGIDSIPVTVTNARAAVRLLPRGTVAFNALPQTLVVRAGTFNARGDTIPATAAATWTTSNAAVASIASFSADVVTLNITSVGTALLTATVPTGGGGTITDTLRINATNDVQAITLSQGTVNFSSVGRTQLLAAQATNAAGGTIPNVTFTWASSANSIATVNSSGLVTAVAPGTATISASFGGKAGTAVVTVGNAPDTVRFTSIDTTLTSVGDSYQPGILLKDAAGNALSTSTVSWGTTDTAVAKVTNQPTVPAGLITAIGVGTARITATSGAATGANDTLRVRSILVVVRNDPFTVTLNRTDDTLTAKTRTLQYTAVVKNQRGAIIPGAGTTQVAWTSSDPTRATVDASGLVTAVDTGNVTITATTTTAGATARTASAALRITNDAASVIVTPGSFSISGAVRTRQLAAVATNQLGATINNPVITWSSSAPSVATVSNSGLVTGVANGTATITATVNGVSGASTVTVLAGTASPSTSTIATNATSVTANGSAAATITVQLKDANGNNITSGSDVVVINTTFGSISPVSGGNGTYTASLTSGTPGTATLTATVNGAAITTASPTVTFVPGPATALSSTIAVSSTSGVADGSTITITVQAKDAQGNNRAVAGDNVVISRTGVGTIAAPSGQTNASGVYTTTISSTATGSATITATINGNTIITGNPVITYAPGAAAKLAVVTQPAGAASGIAFTTQPAVQVLDANNNLVATSTAAITVSIASGGGTLGGTATVNAVNGTASFSGLSISGTAGARTLGFAASGLTGTTSASFTLGVGTPAALSFQTAPSTAGNSGTALATQPVLVVVDGAGNRDTTVNGTVNVTAPGATLSGNSVSLTKGLATFSALTVSGTAGSYVLTFSDGVRSVQSNLALTAGSAAALVFTTSPSTSAGSGAAFATQPVVRVVDAAGNTLTGLSTGTITATAPGLTAAGGSANITNGIATFSTLAFTGTAGSYTVTFSDGTRSLTSSLTLGAGAATQLAIQTQPSATAASGAAFATQPVVRILDAQGNLTSSTAAVTVAIATGGGALGGTATVNAVAGVATFSGLSITGTVGARTLSFTGTSLASATSSSITLSAGAATQLVMVTQPSATAANDALVGTVAVRLQDAAGNNVTTAGVAVNAAIASGGGSLQGTTSQLTDATGTATFGDLRVRGTLGSRTLAFSSSGVTAATSSAVNVNVAGVASQLTLTTAPSAAPQNAVIFPVQPVVQVADISGNPIATAGLPVTAAISSGAGTLGGTLTVNTNASGQAVFTDLVLTGNLSTRTLTFSQASLTLAAQNQPSVTPVP
ncbi:MAG: Ig-like domain-containing protein, partial [Gemmatimonadetes bacterium]|nr:Ig-like domain-containing protein [Gemmatimonadota bacterium]